MNIIRPRRLRLTPNIRSLVQEFTLLKSNLVWPIFVTEIEHEKTEIKNLPGVFRIPLKDVLEEVRLAQNVGLQNIMLFPVIQKEKKDLTGTEATNKNGLMQNCIRKLP